MSDQKHMSHDIVEVEPRYTSSHQRPVLADHENHVHFNPSRRTALITAHPRSSGRATSDALSITLVPEGGNSLLDPPRLWICALGGHPVVVTVESLLYAIKQMQDALLPSSLPGSRETTT